MNYVEFKLLSSLVININQDGFVRSPNYTGSHNKVPLRERFWSSVFKQRGSKGLASLRPTMPLIALRIVQLEMAVGLPSRGGQAFTKSLYRPAPPVNRNISVRITMPVQNSTDRFERKRHLQGARAVEGRGVLLYVEALTRRSATQQMALSFESVRSGGSLSASLHPTIFPEPG